MRNHVAANVIISEIQWTRSRIHYACSPVYSCGKWRKRCANECQRLMYLLLVKKGGEGRRGGRGVSCRDIAIKTSQLASEARIVNVKKEKKKVLREQRIPFRSARRRKMLFSPWDKNLRDSISNSCPFACFSRVKGKKSFARNFSFLFRFAFRFFPFSSILALRNFIFEWIDRKFRFPMRAFALECETGTAAFVFIFLGCLSLRVIVGCRQFRPTWIQRNPALPHKFLSTPSTPISLQFRVEIVPENLSPVTCELSMRIDTEIEK